MKNPETEADMRCILCGLGGDEFKPLGTDAAQRCRDAHDCRMRLAARVETLEEALRPFAVEPAQGVLSGTKYIVNLTVENVRRAREALGCKP